MKKILKPFQIEGTNFLTARRTALLADTMGLGKTIQALAAIEKINSENNLIICPASVRTNWRREIVECGLRDENFSVISYNQAVSMAGSGLNFGAEWGTLILDEAHYLKNPESQRTQAVFANKNGLARRAKRVWALTGTPILNRPRELYPILKTMGGKVLGGYDTFPKFAQRYCGAFFDGRGINTKGSSNLGELAEKLKGFMLRREKREVLADLPPVIYYYPPLELTDAELRPIYKVEFEISDREACLSPTHEDYAQLGDLARLSRVTGVATSGKIVAYVEDLLETVEKVVVFFRHHDVAEKLYAGLMKYCPAVFHGQMNDREKTEAVEKFKSSESRVFLGQIQAAGVGINGLQEVCDNVVFAELTWVPGETDQAIGRLDRIGQMGDSVNVHIPVARNTLAGAMVEVQRGKRAVIEKVVGAKGEER